MNGFLASDHILFDRILATESHSPAVQFQPPSVMEPVPIQEARYDVEAASEKTATEGPQIRETNVDEGVVSEASREGWFARLHAKLHTLATKYGVELRGIERVPSNERTDAGMSKIGTMVCVQVSEHQIC